MTVRILQGDCRDVLKTLPDESVHCVVTSPPYWGLRDYGTAKWEGGDAGCDHLRPRLGGHGDKSPIHGSGHASDEASQIQQFHEVCRKCGARRIDAQIGLEPTPEAYVEKMVLVFREVRRVLRDEGTLWLNLGDSYSGSGKGGNPDEGKQATNKGSQTIGVLYGKTGESAREAALTNVSRRWTTEGGIPPKNLIGIPWRVAFALQADGWYLRQDIIWSKPNPMPESVRDRCTKAHEYLFLLAKSERYYFDAEAISEDMAESSIERLSQPNLEMQGGSMRVPGKTNGAMKAVGHVDKSDYAAATIPGQSAHGYTKRDDGLTSMAPTGKRNKRSVWTVTTQPFKEAHFATFPPALIEPCILAGCPEGGTVLDPFGGAGTTGLVSDRHGRDAILIELNPEYAGMAKNRIIGDSPLFAKVEN